MQNFQVFCSNHEARFEEILGLTVKCFVINRKIDLEGVEKTEAGGSLRAGHRAN